MAEEHRDLHFLTLVYSEVFVCNSFQGHSKTQQRIINKRILKKLKKTKYILMPVTEKKIIPLIHLIFFVL